MITHLIGKLIEKKAPLIIVDVQGIGYEVFAPMSTFAQLPEIGKALTLLTHFVVREDAQQLFGFITETERKLFRALIKVNGIGPKSALSILSGIEIADFITCIQTQDNARLKRIPGIGDKTAERLMIEMRDALSQWENVINKNIGATKINDQDQMVQDALSALETLGYKPNEARSIIAKIPKPYHNHEQLIRLALQQVAKR